MLRLNLRAAFCTAQRAVGRMIAAGRGGSVIFISSQMGHVGASNRTVYCATKHGLEGLAKAMAVELAPFEIRVNTVAPTFIKTAMTASFFEDPEFREDVLGGSPLVGWARPRRWPMQWFLPPARPRGLLRGRASSSMGGGRRNDDGPREPSGPGYRGCGRHRAGDCR